MPEIKCEKCGETNPAEALTCWACGALTPAGRQARQAAQAGTDDDEAWRQSVQAARQRQAARPAVDPDEALKRVLAETGQEPPAGRPRPEPAVELQREARELYGSADTLRSLGALLAFLISLGGLLAAVVGILSGSVIQLLGGIAAFVAIGGLALFVYFQCRFLAEVGHAAADSARQLRRLQVALERLERKSEEERS